MKVLAVGSLPPPIGERSLSFLDELIRQRQDGGDVEVLSPTPWSVAHRYLELGKAGSMVEIAAAARRADRVVVQLAPGFPVSSADRARRAAGLGGLAAALSATSAEVVLLFHSSSDLPRGAGGRPAIALWRRAARIQVGDEATRGDLVSVLGPELGERVVVVPPRDGRSRATARGPAHAESGDDARRLTSLVSARAAGERERCGPSLEGFEGADGERERLLPLWQWIPEPGAGVPPWTDWSAHHDRGGERGPRDVLVAIARSVLHLAERHELTRPAARLARRSRGWLRGASRGATRAAQR